MLIKIGYDIEFELSQPTAMLLMLFVHPSRREHLQKPDQILTFPDIPVQTFYDSFGILCGRVAAPAGRVRFYSSTVVEDSGLPDPVVMNAEQHHVADLPIDVLPFLLASRYCEVDRFGQIAWDLFGTTKLGWSRVQAVMSWVHNHITFGYQHARPTKTAWDGYTERQGVCRDFTHLSITLLRALGIPARYATGYLGDIGIPISPEPMDFSAWIEVYLSGRWWTFDARHNKPRIGRILMARGRDATDVALTTSFGIANLLKFDIVSDELKTY